MGRTRNDFERDGRTHLSHGLAIQLDDDRIAAADDQQRRSGDIGKDALGQVGTPPSRDHGTNENPP